MIKKQILALFVLMTVLSACNNDLDITAPWKDIPIVYGILSVSDDAHYIRVEKAYLDPDKDAEQLAQIADSLYYDNATVELVVNNNKTYTLQRVDGNLEGLQRQPGTFADAPNYLYKIRSDQIQLQGGEEVEFRLKRNESSPVVTAKTIVLPPMEFLSGKPPSQINSWIDEVPLRISFRPNSEEAAIFDVQLIFHYDEIASGQPLVSKSVIWKVLKGAKVSTDQNFITVELSSGDFFQQIGSNIPVNATVERYFRKLDFVILAGGKEIEQFQDITLANTGITGSQDPPIYTNLSEGYGIFTSKSEARAEGILFGPGPRDSLLRGRFTKNLGFKN